MKLTLAAALTLSLVAGAAQAQMMGRGPNPDLDRDGRVTLVEFRRVQADAMLDRLDADGDGKVSRAEMKAMEDRARTFRGEAGAQRVAALWTVADADRNGAITRAEIEARAATRFAAGDINRDGWLSKGELTTMRQNRARED